MISDQRSVIEALLWIQNKGGGYVKTVRSDEGVFFVSGSINLDGYAVADLINVKWIIPDGPRDFRIPDEPAPAAPVIQYQHATRRKALCRA